LLKWHPSRIAAPQQSCSSFNNFVIHIPFADGIGPRILVGMDFGTRRQPRDPYPA
jgi:hypothetical protein